jgi:hypothetical protein
MKLEWRSDNSEMEIAILNILLNGLYDSEKAKKIFLEYFQKGGDIEKWKKMNAKDRGKLKIY